MNWLRKTIQQSPLSARVAPFFVFVGLMVAQPGGGEAGAYWLYLARTIAGAWTLWMARPVITEFRWAFSWEAVAVGIVVCAMWIGIDGCYYHIGAKESAQSASQFWNPMRQFGEGSILAWFFINRPHIFKAPAWRRVATVLFAAGSLGMAWMAVRGGFGSFEVTAITLFWGSFLWLVLTYLGTPFTAPLRWRPLCWVGGISYGVYLLHPVISELIFLHVFGAQPTESMGARGFLLTCFSLAVILTVAYLSFHFVERRLTAIGHRLHYRKREDQRAAVSNA